MTKKPVKKSKTGKKKKEDSNVVPLMTVPSKAEAREMINELIELGHVDWDGHALEMMQKRDISTVNVLNCLQKGIITDNPYPVRLGLRYATVQNNQDSADV